MGLVDIIRNTKLGRAGTAAFAAGFFSFFANSNSVKAAELPPKVPAVANINITYPCNYLAS
jgi:hypothetical protein